MLLGLMFNRLGQANRLLRERTVAVPLAHGGTLAARPVDEPALAAVRWLTASEPTFTTAAWPVGSGIVFAAGRQNSTPYDDLEPMILRMWGEEKVIAACQSHPPSAIMIVQFDMTDAGGKYFGKDYALDLFQWIKANYHRVATFGEADEDRSIDLWLRR
jgi:hypothetical protein